MLKWDLFGYKFRENEAFFALITGINT